MIAGLMPTIVLVGCPFIINILADVGVFKGLTLVKVILVGVESPIT